MSIQKIRHKVRISDMNSLLNPNYKFAYAGLFRSEGEWIHPERTESTYEIIYVTQGEVCLIEGATEINAKKGQLILLSPGVTHAGTKKTSNVSFYSVHFSFEGDALPFKTRFFDSFDDTYLFKELLHTCNLPEIPHYLVNSILVRILSQMCLQSKENQKSYDSTAEKIYEWVRINASAKLTVKNIAEHFGYSADHVSRICKKNYGMGAGELINKFLLLRTKELLSNTNKYVKEIAAELGFSDDKSFIGYFKYHEGCFPSEFRNRYGKLHMNSK